MNFHPHNQSSSWYKVSPHIKTAGLEMSWTGRVALLLLCPCLSPTLPEKKPVSASNSNAFSYQISNENQIVFSPFLQV